ncbi:fibronectin type III domain-containing protein 4-like isoform X1 [Gadus macrocephalus]|uniref:fibronectin type III domain-containing protein 4-like isoform X1 n=1 Tax=Gadus macrocephalus TaxID=80720 RepID=UPI0028CB6BDD|nr:fibronectin type III domain-containing protein 4-like isoform X1 [Gadus macrocephalus]
MDQVKVMTPVRAWLHLDLALLLCSLLASCCRGPAAVGAVVPAAPVNVSVTQLRAHSAMVTWSIPQGDTVIGYAISQQRQDGLMQRFIREVNTSSHWCVLWDLDEDTHYSVQVQSVGLQDDSQPSRTIQFRTLERTDHYPAGVLDHHEPAMEGLDMTPQLQTGELLIITTVLLLWAAVIALFCRQYDIIKDNDSAGGGRDKNKRPSVRAPAVPYYHPSASSSPLYHNGSVHTGKESCCQNGNINGQNVFQ